MDFLANAGAYLDGKSCAVCDAEIEANQAVYFDVESAGTGDEERTTIRVQHGWCHDFVSEQVAAAVNRTLRLLGRTA